MKIGTKIKMADGSIVTVTGNRAIPQDYRYPDGTSEIKYLDQIVFDDGPYGISPKLLSEGLTCGRYQIVGAN